MNSAKVLRFRIRDIEGPVHHGRLNQFHDFILHLEIDKGEPLKIVEMRFAIRFTDLPFHGLASVAPSDPRFADEAIGRVAYYAIKSLKSALAFSGTDIERIISVTREEVDNMREIDPDRVDISRWHDVPGILNRTNRVFISCGQQTAEEIALGNAVFQAVNNVDGLDAYFAENQSSLEGVTNNIFRAIYTSSALITIMHRRNQLTETDWRGSVWIEQEISIAAFLVQSKIGCPRWTCTESGVGIPFLY